MAGSYHSYHLETCFPQPVQPTPLSGFQPRPRRKPAPREAMRGSVTGSVPRSGISPNIAFTALISDTVAVE
jgi:hypothetical protein